MNIVARLNSALIRDGLESFPEGGDWKHTDCCTFGRIPSRGQADWRPISHLRSVGGVYGVLLPAYLFSGPQTIQLHGPNRSRVLFEFQVQPHFGDLAVLYVGRTTNLSQRWRGHLTPGKRKDGGQVKFGMMDCGCCGSENDALAKLQEHARIVYLVLPGPENAANRDIIELALCSRFMPPFNVKSER